MRRARASYACSEPGVQPVAGKVPVLLNDTCPLQNFVLTLGLLSRFAQDQLKELLLDIRGDDPATGFMSYERVERALARILETQRREMARDSEDKIIAAFRALDPDVRLPSRPDPAASLACFGCSFLTAVPPSHSVWPGPGLHRAGGAAGDAHVERGRIQVRRGKAARHLPTLCFVSL